jgi:RNA polymerase sigma-70 factor (ECF subfamily)
MNLEDGDVTALLAELGQGKEDAASRLIPIVYSELRKRAGAYMNRERADHTLQPTALVHETYLKLLQHHTIEYQSRSHFFAVASQIMRRILVDHARSRSSEKRGEGKKPVALEETVIFAPAYSEDLLNLDDALQRLTALDARQGKIVELRFFGGLTVEQTAEVLEISPKTVKRGWSMAKAWLHGELRKSHGSAARKLGDN